jgi:hypothetical protein
MPLIFESRKKLVPKQAKVQRIRILKCRKDKAKGMVHRSKKKQSTDLAIVAITCSAASFL